jgi:ComF family protein
MEPANPNFVLEPEDSFLVFRACTFAYSGRAAQAVRRLKYGRATSLVKYMATQVANRIDELADEDAKIIPVPLHPARRSIRGFNQAELCAEQVKDRLVKPTWLSRIKATRPQAGLPLVERQRNLTDAFRASKEVEGMKIVLVDDVVTSGYTARACAQELLAKGAVEVQVVAFAGNLD